MFWETKELREQEKIRAKIEYHREKQQLALKKLGRLYDLVYARNIAENRKISGENHEKTLK